MWERCWTYGVILTNDYWVEIGVIGRNGAPSEWWDSDPMRRKNVFDGNSRYITFRSVGNVPHWIPSSSHHNFTQPTILLLQCLFLSATGLPTSLSSVVSLSAAKRAFPTAMVSNALRVWILVSTRRVVLEVNTPHPNRCEWGDLDSFTSLTTCFKDSQHSFYEGDWWCQCSD